MPIPKTQAILALSIASLAAAELAAGEPGEAESFVEVRDRMAEARPRVMSRQQELLEQRYMLTDCAAPEPARIAGVEYQPQSEERS